MAGLNGCTMCAGIDNSRAITLGTSESTLEESAVTGGLTAEEYAAVASAIGEWSSGIVVGYWHDPSCHKDPWHEADLVDYYSQSEASNNWYRDDVTLDAQQATVRYALTDYIGELDSLELTGTFRIDLAQAALDQQYPPDEIHEFVYVEPADRLAVPVSWQAAGEIGGKQFTASYATISRVN
ncbi:hypothetical protein JW859_09045 [bacterium]|nr:hypothetical protein [bacterium]